MKFVDFKHGLAQFLVFSVHDIRKLWPDFDLRRLVEWQKKGYIRKIIKGYYLFQETTLTENVLFFIANQIYQPSYISLEGALAFYNFIPEEVFTTTSVTTNKTTQFITEQAAFSYQTIKKELFFGYKLEAFGNYEFKMAEPEKAFLDFLYLHPEYNDFKHIQEWRVNSLLFREKIRKEVWSKYLALFGSQALQSRADRLLSVVL